MADLYGALLAAAEEAKKDKEEHEELRKILLDTRDLVNELYSQNYELKKKLKTTGKILQEMAETLISTADL